MTGHWHCKPTPKMAFALDRRFAPKNTTAKPYQGMRQKPKQAKHVELFCLDNNLNSAKRFAMCHACLQPSPTLTIPMCVSFLVWILQAKKNTNQETCGHRDRSVELQEDQLQKMQMMVLEPGEYILYIYT